MKYKMKLQTIVYAIIGIVCAITITSIVLDSLIISGSGGFQQGNVAITAVSLVCSILLLLVCVLMFINTKYAFKDTFLVVNFGIVQFKLLYENIVAYAIETISNRLFIQYSSTDNKEKLNVLAINIKGEDNDNFVAELKKHNENISCMNSNTKVDIQ